MTRTTYQWTIEHYHQAIDAGCFEQQSVELLKGEIILMTPERESHAYYNSEWADYLRKILGNKAKIRENKPIILPNNSEPVPDIAIVKPLGIEYLKHHPYPDDIYWLIEFSKATLKKDLTEKKAIYAEAGIKEYWIVDLKNNQLKVFRDLKQGNYQIELTLTTGNITPLDFPDLVIPVSQLMLD
ncbi:Uma2 family endonuclease [Crocosphaera sp. XPORK-15E]|uniref:Uma2 family endonuclease n=1 Tax=Crocosphaera sp. XPORK-15E TaxID=3110247 RepID=UPI002B214223|nr:Uma2 family endonuclease [Crocosphaera sp. XPORK-15E]MEA5534754.1 Uma2 family endonuclease [Crocosphaera sp. XPORK-15E]